MRHAIVLRTAVLCLALVGNEASVRADDPGLTADAPRFDIRLNVGAEFILPTVGLAFTYAATSFLWLEAAAEGSGWLGGKTWMEAKLVLGSGQTRFLTGAGPEVDFLNGWTLRDQSRRGSPRLSIRADSLGFQHRFSNGVSLTGVLGITIGLAGDEYCPGIECHPDPYYYDTQWTGALFPHAQFGAGYSW